MIVYPAEVNDGLEGVVQAKASVSCCSNIITNNSNIKVISDSLLAKAAVNDLDLYPVNSILVSIGWNKNDDIFCGEEVLAAKDTPRDKPFNLMHKQVDIIGHTISNILIDGDFNKLEVSEAKDLPSKFHILTSDVIYKFWEDPARAQQIANIINEIETSDKWAVSMECLFSEFDYGILHPNGESRVLARNAETSILTKHLRCYGGSGLYNNFRIGRVLRHITFSGKGLVDNPANPESKIIRPFQTIATTLGYINTSVENSIGESNMADTEKKDEKTEAAKQISDLQATISKLEKQLAEMKVEIQSKTPEGEEHMQHKDWQTHHKEMEAKDKEIIGVRGELKDEKEKGKKMEEDCKALKTENDAYKATINEYKAATKKAERTKSLVSKGSSLEVAESLVKDLMEMSDANFTSFLETFAKTMKDDLEKDKSKGADDKEMDEEKTEADVLATAKVETNANLGVSMTKDEQKLSKAIAEWWSNTRNKGRE